MSTVLAVLLVALPVPPPTLGDALREIGAFSPESAIDRSLQPPPPPPRVGATILMATGAALVVTGILGTVLSPHCATRAADGRCVDQRGSADIYPALMFAGFATAITGSYWYRQDL